MNNITIEETANCPKKKILLISDDLRMTSGIATITRELVLGVAHKYNFAVIAGGIKHPEAGKIIDLSDATNKARNIKDSYVKLYPVDGYGNEQIVNQIIQMEKPDVLLFITDPRFFGWLFAIENQIRQKIPMVYINIWDNLCYPQWNRPAYQSCDCLMSISKQTANIVKWTIRPEFCFSLDGEFDKDGTLIPRN